MQDVLTMMDRLTRPKLLIRAARLGAEHYHRDTHLPRVLGYGQMPRTTEALLRLMQQEADVNRLRKTQDTTYSLPAHLDLLIAMVGEARILRSCQISRDIQFNDPNQTPT